MKQRNINIVYEYETPVGPLWGGLDVKDYPEVFYSILNDEIQDIENKVIRINQKKYSFAESMYSHTMTLFKKYSDRYTHNKNEYNLKFKHISEIEDKRNEDLNIFIIPAVYFYTVDKEIGNNFNILNSLSKTLKQKLSINKNFYLYMMDEWEGSYHFHETFIKNIKKFCKTNNINSHKILYSSSNNFIRTKNEPFCNFFPINPYILTGSEVNAYDMFGNLRDSVTAEDLDYNKKRENKFLCYNRNSSRLHRLLLISYLKKDDILDSSVVSLYENDFFNDIENLKNTRNFEGLRFSKNDISGMIDVIENNYPLHLDFSDQQTAAQSHNYLSTKEHYLKTYISLVTETSVSDDFCFITEKTMRPMLGYHPFIVFGSAYTLKKLKEFGFMTFDKIIDESYDNEMDVNKRFKMAYNEVLKLNSLPFKELHEKYYSIVPILEHNYKLILSLNDDDSYVRNILNELINATETNNVI